MMRRGEILTDLVDNMGNLSHFGNAHAAGGDSWGAKPDATGEKW